MYAKIAMLMAFMRDILWKKCEHSVVKKENKQRVLARKKL
jgi:hypothetical protein